MQNKFIGSLENFFNVEMCMGIAIGSQLSAHQWLFRHKSTKPLFGYGRLYISVMTSSGITFSVSSLWRVLDKTTQQAWNAAKRVLRYLVGTKDFTKSGFDIVASWNSDWIRDTQTWKSVSRFIAYHGRNPFAWPVWSYQQCNKNFLLQAPLVHR